MGGGAEFWWDAGYVSHTKTRIDCYDFLLSKYTKLQYGKTLKWDLETNPETAHCA